MGKKTFNLLTTVKSNEVSLCSKYNSGANKQTEFEIVKDAEGNIDKDVKPVIEELIKFADFYGVEEENKEENAFKDFLNYWIEYDINNTYYNLLSEALQNAMCDIKYADISKDEKVEKYKELFNMFIDEYKNLPITKTKEGKFEVSLVSNSHIKEDETNPQNETDVITKEKTNTMEKQSMFEQAIDLLKNAFSLTKTETPADEQQEEKTEVEVETETEVEVETKENAEKEVETQAVEEENEAESKEVEVESPVVEAEAKVEAEKETETEVAEENKEVAEEVTKTSETDVEALIKAKLEVEKELEQLKKSQVEKEIEIEKMSFIQKAKDEYSMLVGTPEEIGEKLYSISKSNLGEEVKTFVMEQLKKVAEENKELTTEVGSITKNAGDMTEEERIYAKAEEIAKAKNISLNKALREISK